MNNKILNIFGFTLVFLVVTFLISLIGWSFYFGYKDIQEAKQCEDAGYRYNYYHDCVDDEDKVVAPRLWRVK